MDKSGLTFFIKNEAKKMGFDEVGISPSEFLETEANKLENWLKQGFNGKMDYMANHFEQRLNPGLLVENAQSVISLSYNYYSEETQSDPTAPKISKYAYGHDYHTVIKEKLKTLLGLIQEKTGDINGRCFVDSAPVMERVWAQKGGLGWIGKNTLLLTKGKGSYFFLAEIILDVELVYDNVISKDYCGQCTKCIDACPTEAIIAPYQVDGSKCISYFTIELKDALLPSEMKGKMDNWMFGCDVCQQVCPINARAKPHQEPLFEPHPDLLHMSKREWEEITEEVFQKLFKHSPVKRTKYAGLKRNINFLTEK